LIYVKLILKLFRLYGAPFLLESSKPPLSSPKEKHTHIHKNTPPMHSSFTLLLLLLRRISVEDLCNNNNNNKINKSTATEQQTSSTHCECGFVFLYNSGVGL
jgi:hypothetical protein